MHCANFPRHLGRQITRCLIAHPNGAARDPAAARHSLIRRGYIMRLRGANQMKGCTLRIDVRNLTPQPVCGMRFWSPSENVDLKTGNLTES
jgi:hypothetical protein